MGGIIYQQLSVNGIPFKYALIRTPVSFMLGASFQGMFFTTNRSWVADVILPIGEKFNGFASWMATRRGLYGRVGVSVDNRQSVKCKRDCADFADFYSTRWFSSHGGFIKCRGILTKSGGV